MRHYSLEVTKNGLFIVRGDNDTYAFSSYLDLEAYLNKELTSTVSSKSPYLSPTSQPSIAPISVPVKW